METISRLLTPWRLKWYPVALLFGMLIAFNICIFSYKDGKILSGYLGGDFPAFYAAGQLVASGDYKHIYNLDRLASEQKKYVAGEEGVLPFPYPPHVAFIYAPLSFLSYRSAYIVHTILMSSALVVATLIIMRINRELNNYFFLVLALFFSFYPTFKSIIGGQNSVVTLLLICLIWENVLKDRLYLSGIFLGILLFKPQFAFPLMGLFALSGRWRVTVTSVTIGMITYGISYAVLDNMLLEWINFVTWFSQTDAGVNKINAISLLGFIEAIIGNDSTLSYLIGGLFILATIAIVSSIWFVGGKRSDFNSQLGIACPALVLIPPHVMYYDISICIISFIVLLKYAKSKINFVLIFWLLGLSQLFSFLFGFSLLFFAAVSLFALSIYVLFQPSPDGGSFPTRSDALH